MVCLSEGKDFSFIHMIKLYQHYLKKVPTYIHVLDFYRQWMSLRCWVIVMVCLSEGKDSLSFLHMIKLYQHFLKKVPYYIFNILQAMEEFDMLKDGDRVMVCLSGGKDSLSLLHTMKQYQHYLKKVPIYIFNILQAMEEFDMLKDGDRVMVCLSGGKDSLSLLHTMKQYQHYLKKKNISFELGAVTVDPMTPSYDPSPLIKYCAALGVPYAFEQQCRCIFIAQLLIRRGSKGFLLL